MTWWEAGLRVLLAIGIGSAIGLEREWKNKPAGTRTHILVCLGAAIIAVMENHVEQWVLAMNVAEANTGITVSMGRLSAQVISGIGFLGAGTIFSSRKKIGGLTTAASLWCTGCLGLAAGMGCYALAVMGCVMVLLTLTVVQRMTPAAQICVVEVRYVHRTETNAYIRETFLQQGVEVLKVDFRSAIGPEGKEYTSIYTVSVMTRGNPAEQFGTLADYPHVRDLHIHEQE